MLVYAKHPTEKQLWIVFEQSEQGKLTRVCSYNSSPKGLGYKRISWPDEYEGKPLTEFIKIL